MKRFFIPIFVALLLVAFALPVSAAEGDNPPAPLPDVLPATSPLILDNTGDVSTYSLNNILNYGLRQVSRSGNTLTVVGFTQGNYNATSVWVRCDLYRRPTGSSSSWTKCNSGTARNDATGHYISAKEVWGLSSSYEYKVVGTHTAYGKGSETVNSSSLIK